MSKNKYSWAVRKCAYYEHFSQGGEVVAILDSKIAAQNWIVQYGNGKYHYYIDKIPKETKS